MKQTISITALLDALTHPAQQHPILARTYHPQPYSASEYTIRHNMLYYPMSDGKSEWQLIIPLSGEFEMDWEYIRFRAEQCTLSQIFAEARYFHKAIILFNTHGEPYTVPALLQRSHLNLDGFIRHNGSAKHRKRLRLALESLALGAEQLMRENATHDSLTRQRICFDKECKLQLTDYPIAVGKQNNAVQLGEAAILLFVAGCQVGAYRAISTQSTSLNEHNHRLRCILAAAQHYSISSLVKLTEQIMQDAPSESIIEGIKAVAGEPFRAMPLLEGLLCGKEVALHHIPSHDADNTIVVEFDLCDEVLPAGEGLVRYRRGELWGYAHESGERVVIERVLLYAEEFNNGRAVIRTSRGYGLMDLSGRMVMNDVWEHMEWYHEEGIITAADSQGKWRIYDSQGRQLSTTPADWMGSVAEGYVVARCDNKFSYYSVSGQKLTNFMYDEAFSFHNGIALVTKGDKRYHIDTSFHRIASDIEKVVIKVRGQ